MRRITRLTLLTVAGVLAIGLACWWAVNLITANIKADTANTLTTVLNTSHQALLYWFEESSEVARAWAASPEVQQQASGLLAGPQDAESLRNSPRLRNLDTILAPAMMEDHSQGYFIVDTQNRVFAASNREEIGELSLLGQVPAQEALLLAGESFVSLPLFRSRSSQQEATMLAGAPIFDDDGEIVAGLVFYTDPDVDFSAILQRGRLGATGETYAINSQGRLISDSRFDNQLRAAGLLQPRQSSVLHVAVTDPGANLITREGAPIPLAERQPTRMAQAALAGEGGLDLDGYRDYRGVEVVGAWLWNAQHQFGLAIEVDRAQAFASLSTARTAIISLAVLSSAALVSVVLISNASQRREEMAQRRYELTVEGAMDAIISFDNADRITAWNSQAEDMFGWKKAEALGSSLAAQILPNELKERYYRRLQRMQDEKEDFFARQRRELALKRRDGSTFPSELFLVPYQLGEETGFSAFIRDMTEIQEAQRQLQRTHEELAQSYDATLRGWSRALDLRDHETEGHTQRVAENAVRLAAALGVPEEERLHIYRGALLHDIGKIGIPDRILLKPGPLAEEEWEVMKMHPLHAYNFLNKIPYLRLALDIPRYHHEKWDGSGYPDGLVGEAIPFAARLFAVADVWDALTADRPYRKAWEVEKAREYIRYQGGKHFDPAIVEAFLNLTDT